MIALCYTLEAAKAHADKCAEDMVLAGEPEVYFVVEEFPLLDEEHDSSVLHRRRILVVDTGALTALLSEERELSVLYETSPT